MYLIVIAWLYVALMAALAEATNPQGSLLGAALTFGLYGLLPMAIVVYILGTPARKRRLRAQQAAAQAAWEAEQAAQPTANALVADPDAGGKTPAGASVAAAKAVREEP